MLVILLGLAALLPSLLLVMFFHRSDQFPEPPGVLWRTFGLGILIVFPVLAIAFPLDSLANTIEHPLFYGFASAFLGAAIPEELCKFMVLYFYAARHMEFDEPMDGLVYGATASLGFATLENVLYVSEGGFGVALIRAVMAVPSHGFLGVIMGYYVARAKFEPERAKHFLVRALVVPIVLHGLYNTPLLATERLGDNPTATAVGWVVLLLLPMAPAIVLGELIWTLRLVREFKAEQLAVAAATTAATPTAPGMAAPAEAWTPAPTAPAILHRGEAAWPLAIPQTAHVPAPDPGLSTGQQIRGWFLVLGGGGLTLFGGLVLLGIVFSLQDPTVVDGEFTDLLVGGAIVGLLPAIVGMGLFFFGIRCLNPKRG